MRAKREQTELSYDSERVVREERTPAFTYGRTPVVAAGRRIVSGGCGACAANVQRERRAESAYSQPRSLDLLSSPSLPFSQPLFSSFLLPCHPSLPLLLHKCFLHLYYALMNFLFSFLDYVNDDENSHWLRDRRNLIKIFPLVDVLLILAFAHAHLSFAILFVRMTRDDTREPMINQKASVTSL